jgi:hypothetical protein
MMSPRRMTYHREKIRAYHALNFASSQPKNRPMAIADISILTKIDKHHKTKDYPRQSFSMPRTPQPREWDRFWQGDCLVVV